MRTRIYVTGRIAVEHAGTLAFDERSLPGRQGRLAFAYLTANLHRAVSKSELIEALWGDSPPREVDVTLSAVLSQLRALLRKGLPGAGIEVAQGSIGLRVPANAWLDIEAASNAIDQAEGAERRGDGTGAWGHASVAAVIGGARFSRQTRRRGSKDSDNDSDRCWSGRCSASPPSAAGQASCQPRFSMPIGSSRSNPAAKPCIRRSCGCTSAWATLPKRSACSRSVASGSRRAGHQPFPSHGAAASVHPPR